MTKAGVGDQIEDAQELGQNRSKTRPKNRNKDTKINEGDRWIEDLMDDGDDTTRTTTNADLKKGRLN